MSVVGFAYARTCWRVYMLMEQQQQLFSRWSGRQMELKPVPATSLRPPLEYIITRLSQGQKPDRDKLDRERRTLRKRLVTLRASLVIPSAPPAQKAQKHGCSPDLIMLSLTVISSSLHPSRAAEHHFTPPPSSIPSHPSTSSFLCLLSLFASVSARTKWFCREWIIRTVWQNSCRYVDSTKLAN